MKTTILAALTVALAFATSAPAALVFSDNFETPPNTLGSSPVNFTVSGTSGTSTGNVATDGGTQVLAYVDNDPTVNLTAVRNFAGTTYGVFSFKIKINSGTNTNFTMVLGAPGGYVPVNLGFETVGGGIYFSAPGTYLAPGNFPYDSWQDISVTFDSTATTVNGPNTGVFSVTWNAITTNFLYLNQGGQNLLVDKLTISGQGASGVNVNTQFDDFLLTVPEPASLSLLGLGGAMLVRRRKA